MRVSVYVPEASPEELNTSTMSDGVCSVSGTTVSPGAFHVAFTPNRGREGDVECALAYGGPGHAADPVGHGARVQLFGAGFGHVHGHPHPVVSGGAAEPGQARGTPAGLDRHAELRGQAGHLHGRGHVLRDDGCW